MPAGRPALHALQVHNSYLVTQDEDGLVIIDQHALHERVMYERLKRRIDERGELESQRLLIPVMVEVPESCDVSLLVSMSGLLRRLGILAEAVGPNAVSVSAYPTFLAEKGVEPAAFVGALLEESEPDGRGEDSESLLHEILDMMACKAAVKAGDRLSDEELADLLATRGEVDRSSRCPHGRPTAVRLSVSELERQFGR
jgi:DNA mismatch repair protein MutL